MSNQKKSVSLTRPQEPIRPFPYHEEEVNYSNQAAGITISGTLTTPFKSAPFPAVLLISGMGPNDRDYTTCGHKLFLVLADHLTRHGIAVLRVDKRGVGRSTGTFDLNATSIDFAHDVLAGIEYLKTRKEINSHQIGLIGHSEGGMIAAMVAAQSPDIAFIVMMAPAMLTSINDVVEQVSLQLKADGATQELIAHDCALRKQLLSIVTQEKDFRIAQKHMLDLFSTYWTTLPDILKQESSKLSFAFSQDKANDMINMLNSPWYRFFLSNKPLATVKQIKVPVLAINGDLDWITSVKTLSVIGKALEEAGNRDYMTIELPNLNHQFRTCKTGSLEEYSMIKETMAPVAMNTISNWILD